MTIYVVRALLQLRNVLASNRQLAVKFAELESKVSSHDRAVVGILEAIRELISTAAEATAHWIYSQSRRVATQRHRSDQ
jgi:hypothetical protein